MAALGYAAYEVVKTLRGIEEEPAKIQRSRDTTRQFTVAKCDSQDYEPAFAGRSSTDSPLDRDRRCSEAAKSAITTITHEPRAGREKG